MIKTKAAFPIITSPAALSLDYFLVAPLSCLYSLLSTLYSLLSTLSLSLSQGYPPTPMFLSHPPLFPTVRHPQIPANKLLSPLPRLLSLNSPESPPQTLLP